MKKIFLIISIFIFSVTSFSENVIRKKDLKKVDKIYYLKNSNVPFTGKISEGKDRFYYLDGKQDGKWIEFYKNGNIKSIINWKNGRLDGKYIIYENNGMKSTEATYRTKGAYSMGKPIGVWEYYDKNGKLTGKGQGI